MVVGGGQQSALAAGSRGGRVGVALPLEVGPPRSCAVRFWHARAPHGRRPLAGRRCRRSRCHCRGCSRIHLLFLLREGQQGCRAAPESLTVLQLLHAMLIRLKTLLKNNHLRTKTAQSLGLSIPAPLHLACQLLHSNIVLLPAACVYVMSVNYNGGATTTQHCLELVVLGSNSTMYN